VEDAVEAEPAGDLELKGFEVVCLATCVDSRRARERTAAAPAIRPALTRPKFGRSIRGSGKERADVSR